jgi:secondary thiamine-phosphate synthase enzyme
MNYQLTVPVHGQGLYDVTHKVAETISGCDVTDGLATIFIRHTSASLVIQENADAAVRVDLERWLNRLVAEHDPLYTHTVEGPDDMPAHIKSALTAVSISVPIMAGELALGTWQGIYLWEHRHHRGERHLIVNVMA